jgi:hypothetical protein
VYAACIYCDGPVRARSLVIEGQFAHRACEADVADDTFHAKRGLE